jgi:hypothetical protein
MIGGTGTNQKESLILTNMRYFVILKKMPVHLNPGAAYLALHMHHAITLPSASSTASTACQHGTNKPLHVNTAPTNIQAFKEPSAVGHRN